MSNKSIFVQISSFVAIGYKLGGLKPGGLKPGGLKPGGLKIIGFIIGSFIFFGQLTVGYCETKATNAPLNVVSDKMIAKKDTSMVEFLGNVKITQEDSVTYADSIQIFFVDENEEKNSESQSNLKKIIAMGNVKYTTGERKAFADKAVYTAKDEILILTGKGPKLITGSSFVTGKKITLFRKTDKVVVESDGSKRVEALFNPEDNITEENNTNKQ